MNEKQIVFGAIEDLMEYYKSDGHEVTEVTINVKVFKTEEEHRQELIKEYDGIRVAYEAKKKRKVA